MRVQTPTQMSPGALLIPLMKRKEVRTTCSACPPEPHAYMHSYTPFLALDPRRQALSTHSNTDEPQTWGVFLQLHFHTDKYIYLHKHTVAAEMLIAWFSSCYK